MNEWVSIMEVGPRDGLQNEPVLVDTPTRVELIQRLVATGLTHIEVGAFVSPKWVPQMANSATVLCALDTQSPTHFYPVLVPNQQGLEAAIAANARDIAIFGAASEAFSQKNINCSIAESLKRFALVVKQAQAANIRVRGYVSCAVGCPYQGHVAPEDVASVARALYDMGCYEISLGDTIGVGTPKTVLAMWDAVCHDLPNTALAGHFHNTYGMAIANIYASLERGIRTFDASVAGLGGCPYARRASGNVATEELVYLLQGLGFQTGIDLPRLIETAHFIATKLGRPPASHVAQALHAP